MRVKLLLILILMLSYVFYEVAFYPDVATILQPSLNIWIFFLNIFNTAVIIQHRNKKTTDELRVRGHRTLHSFCCLSGKTPFELK